MKPSTKELPVPPQLNAFPGVFPHMDMLALCLPCPVCKAKAGRGCEFVSDVEGFGLLGVRTTKRVHEERMIVAHFWFSDSSLIAQEVRQ